MITQSERSTFFKASIPEEKKTWEHHTNWKNKCRESDGFQKKKKNIWEPSGSWEKIAALSWNSFPPLSLSTLPSFLPASHPANTFPQKAKRRGRAQCIRGLRETLSSTSAHSLRLHKESMLLTDGIDANLTRSTSSSCESHSVSVLDLLKHEMRTQLKKFF